MDVDDVTVGPSPNGITVGQLIDSVQGLPDSVEASIVVRVTQKWEISFEVGGEDADETVEKLVKACQVISPSCTATLVSSRRRALESGTGTVTFLRSLSNSSAEITEIPQLKASGVNVTNNTFFSTKAVLSVTTQGGVEDASALSEGSLSPEKVTSTVSADLGLNEDALFVALEKPIFPPMPPPSLPPSPPSAPPSPPPP